MTEDQYSEFTQEERIPEPVPLGGEDVLPETEETLQTPEAEVVLPREVAAATETPEPEQPAEKCTADEQDAQLSAEEPVQTTAEDDSEPQLEEEAQKLAEEEARKQAEEEAQKRAEEEARKQAEEEIRRQAEEEALRQAEEEARRLEDLRKEEEAQRQAEEAQRQAEEALLRADDDTEPVVKQPGLLKRVFQTLKTKAQRLWWTVTAKIKKFFSSTVRTAAVVAGLLVLALILFVFGGGNMKKVKKAFQKTEKAVATSELLRYLQSFYESGSLTAEVDLTKLAGLIGGSEGSVNVSVYHTSKNHAAALSAAYENGADAAQLLLTVSDTELALSSEALLGEKAYGLSLKNLTKNLPGSVLDPASESLLGSYLGTEVLQNIYDQLMEWKDGPAAEGEQLQTAAAEALQEGWKVFYQSVKKNAETEIGSDRLDIGDDEVRCRQITLTIDEKAAKYILKDMVSWAKDSKKLKSLLEAVQDDLAAAAELGMGWDAGTLTESIYRELNELDCADLAENLEDRELIVVFSINRGNGQLVGISGGILEEGDEDITDALPRFTLTAGPNVKKLSAVQLQLRTAEGKTTYRLISEEEGNEQILTLKQDRTKLVQLTRNEKDSSFTLAFGSRAVQGSWSKKSNTLSITPSRLIIYSDTTRKTEQYTLSLKGTELTLNTKVKLPQISKYTDILTLSEEDLEELGTAIAENVGALPLNP